MNIVLSALKQNVRYSTSKGMLNTEQLFDISMADLARAIKDSHKILGESSLGDELSFLGSTTVSAANQTEQLRFEIMKEVYQLRKAELDLVKQAKEIKEHNAKIDALIAQKQDESLTSMSIEDLIKLRK